MVFELEIKNTGYGGSSFYLFTENMDNTGGLNIWVNGESLSHPSTWFLPGTQAGGKITTAVLTIDRGPSKFIYPPVTLYLESKCEYIDEFSSAKASTILSNSYNSETKTSTLEYTENCPVIEWAADLKKYEKFVINTEDAKNTDGYNTLSVQIFNPFYKKIK